MMNMNIISKLNNFRDEEKSDLMIAIIDDILNVSTDEIEIKEYMENVINYGCQSGIVGSLIYYYQTNDFFKTHFEEIFELCNELKEEGMNLEFELTANDFSWFAYEVLVDRLYNELGLEEE